jgi:hypothetical protein
MSISDSLSSLDSSSNSLSKQINYIYKMSYHQINTTFYQDWFVKKNISSKSTVGQKDFFLQVTKHSKIFATRKKLL